MSQTTLDITPETAKQGDSGMKYTRHIYRDQFGLIASIRVNGKQRLKRVKTEQQAHEWFLLMETNSIPAASLTFKQLNDAASALSALKQAGLDMTLYEAVTNWLNAEQSPAELKNPAFPSMMPLRSILNGARENSR